MIEQVTISVRECRSALRFESHLHLADIVCNHRRRRLGEYAELWATQQSCAKGAFFASKQVAYGSYVKLCASRVQRNARIASSDRDSYGSRFCTFTSVQLSALQCCRFSSCFSRSSSMTATALSTRAF
eukprot:6203727-Pleurochrysis_carterae.AAC.3